MKLAAGTGGATAGAAVVKVDNAAAKRRPKSTKRKKPTDATTPASSGTPSLHTGAAGVLPLAPQPRIDGLTTPGAKSDSGVKLETESVGAGDDSGINMSDTWQRNGHSADFIRQSLGQFALIVVSWLLIDRSARRVTDGDRSANCV